MNVAPTKIDVPAKIVPMIVSKELISHMELNSLIK